MSIFDDDVIILRQVFEQNLHAQLRLLMLIFMVILVLCLEVLWIFYLFIFFLNIFEIFGICFSISIFGTVWCSLIHGIIPEGFDLSIISIIGMDSGWLD